MRLQGRIPLFCIPEPPAQDSFSCMVAMETAGDEDVAGPLFSAGINNLFMYRRKPHFHQRYEASDHHRIRLQLEGHARFRLNGVVHIVDPGDLVVTVPGEPYSYTGSRTGWCWTLCMTVNVTKSWEILRSSAGLIRNYESADYMYLLARRILDARGSSDRRVLEHARQECYTLVNLIRRDMIPRDASKEDEDLAELRDMVARIRQDPGLDWSVDRMASESHQSKSTLTRMCRREYGLAPRKLVIKHRLSRAVELLAKTDLTIEKVALAVGYGSAYTLSNLFVKHLGYRPSVVRTRWADSGH